MTDVRHDVFFQVHRDLPREGPGSRECTWRALDLAELSGDQPLTVMDVGCGPGKQTLDLAERLPHAHIIALDLHAGFLRDLATRVRAAAVPDQVLPVRGDMTRPPLAAGTADLIWCEGAAYNMGVDAALAWWWQLLVPGGVCAFTEVAWLKADPPQPVRDFWAAYPAMTDLAGNRTLVRQQGFEMLGDFVLPAAAWWDDYYDPMSERLTVLEVRHADAPEVLAVLAGIRAEIELYRRYGAWYGYLFLVARKP